MTIPRIDWFNFLFNNGRGIRLDQIFDPNQPDGVPVFGTGGVTVVPTLDDIVNAESSAPWTYVQAARSLLIPINMPVANADPKGTFEAIPARNSLTINNNLPSPAVLNAYVYRLSDGHFYVGTMQGTRVHWLRSTPEDALAASRSVATYSVVWLDSQINDDHAIYHVRALVDDTDYFYYNRTENEIRRLDRDTYVAPDTAADHWLWARADQSVIDRLIPVEEAVPKIGRYAENPQANGAALLGNYQLINEDYFYTVYDSDAYSNNSLLAGQVMLGELTSGVREFKIHFQDIDIRETLVALRSAISQECEIRLTDAFDSAKNALVGTLVASGLTQEAGNIYSVRVTQTSTEVLADAKRIVFNIQSVIGKLLDNMGARVKMLEDNPGGGGSTLAIGTISVNPERIDAATDLDGTYQVIVSLTDAEVTNLTNRGVNYLEIWFGSESIHTVSPWAPALSTRIDAVIDSTEESSIGSIGNTLVVRAVYRVNQGGSQTFYAEGAGALRIGGYPAFTEEVQKEITAGDDLQSITVGSLGNYTAALAAQVTSDQPLELVFATAIILNAGTAQQVTYNVGDVVYFAPRSDSPERRFNVVDSTMLASEASQRQAGDEFAEYSASTSAELNADLATHAGLSAKNGAIITLTGDFVTSTRTYKSGERFYLAPHHRDEGEMVLVSEVPDAIATSLTQAQEIALLAFIPDPSVIRFKTIEELETAVKTIGISIPNPELLTGDVWVEGWTQGQRGLDRVKWASTTTLLRITVGDSTATDIATAVASDDSLEVRLRFYDAATAGNEIERIGVNIPLVDQRDVGLSEAEVDARVKAGVLDPAETGNTDRWPVAKLGSGTASATTFLAGDGSWKAPPTGPGGADQVARDAAAAAQTTADSKLTQAQVDARVQAGVLDPAEEGNTDRWPVAKLGSGTASATTFLAGDGEWKTPGVTDEHHDSSSGGLDSRDHARISVLEELTEELELEEHATWENETDVTQYAIHILATPASYTTNALPGYPWALSKTIPSDGNYIILLRVANSGTDTNSIRIRRVDDSDAEQDLYRGGWRYAGLDEGGFDYYLRPAEAMMENDVLTIQDAPSATAYTRYLGEVTKLDEHEADAEAHKDAIDARVKAGVLDPAETGNTDRWPVAKLGSGTASATTFLAGDGSWKAPPAGVETFTQAQQIALLNIILSQPIITYKIIGELEDDLKSISIEIPNSELLTGDAWVEVWVQGQLGTTSATGTSGQRIKWAHTFAGITTTFRDNEAEDIASAVAGTGEIDLRLHFYDASTGGNEIERIGINIPLVDRRDITPLEERNPTALTAITFNAALAIDWNSADGVMRSTTLTANTTITFSNVSSGDVIVLRFTQDATGGRTITWPAAVKWAGGTAEGPSADANSIDVFTLLALSPTEIVATAILDIK